MPLSPTTPTIATTQAAQPALVIDTSPLKDQIAKLEEENKELKARLAEKEKQLGETIVRHQDELVELKILVAQSQKAELDLQSKYESLLVKYGALQSENEALKSSLATLQAEVESMKVTIKELQTRDAPITVREAMRVLEGHICLEIAGSKSKAKRRLFTLELISASTNPTIKASFANFLGARKLTTEHVDILSYLKTCCNAAAHDERPSLTYEELLNLTLESTEEEDKPFVRDLMALLDEFVPKDATGRLQLRPPCVNTFNPNGVKLV